MGMQAAQQQAMAPAQNMANRGAFAAGVPALAAAQAQQPQQSVEQQALNGGGVDNKQQISNFMNALRGVHAGDNNTFSQGTEPQAQGAPAPLVGLVGPQATQQFPAGQTPFQIPSRAPIVQNNDFIMRALGADSGGLAPAPHQPVPIPGSAAPSTASSPANTGMNSGAGGLVGGGTMSGGGAPAPVPAPFQRNMPTFDPSVMAAMSDETQKDHVSDATGKLTDFMSTIGAHSYQYKDPDADGHGTYTTPMAQELQKTELGKQAVIETPRGLMVNYGRLGGVTLAAVSVVHREQQKLAQQVEWLRGELRKGRS
jgi:hypothetical protein